MNKAQLIELIATAIEQPKTVATNALEAVLANIKDALIKNEDVILPGFGTFSVKHRAARKGRNPQTGQEIQIAESRAVTFKTGKALKDAVNS